MQSLCRSRRIDAWREAAPSMMLRRERRASGATAGNREDRQSEFLAPETSASAVIRQLQTPHSAVMLSGAKHLHLLFVTSASPVTHQLPGLVTRARLQPGQKNAQTIRALAPGGSGCRSEQADRNFRIAGHSTTTGLTGVTLGEKRRRSWLLPASFGSL